MIVVEVMWICLVMNERISNGVLEYIEICSFSLCGGNWVVCHKQEHQLTFIEIRGSEIQGFCLLRDTKE